MDILSEVLDALRLRSTGAARLEAPVSLRAEIEQGFAAIIVVSEGRGLASTGRSSHELVENDYLLLAGPRSIEISSSPQAPLSLIRCDFSLLSDLPHPLARQLPAVARLGARYLTDRAELGRTVALLESELVNAPPGTDFVAARAAEIAFVEVLRKCQLESQENADFLGALADGPVRASLEAIHREPQRAWHVDDLAAAAGLSRAVFAERFHRLVGEPPLRYLRRWRLLNARRELVRGGVAVRTIAERTGYRSANGFSRAYRRFFGESPTASRGRSR